MCNQSLERKTTQSLELNFIKVSKIKLVTIAYCCDILLPMKLFDLKSNWKLKRTSVTLFLFNLGYFGYFTETWERNGRKILIIICATICSVCTYEVLSGVNFDKPPVQITVKRILSILSSFRRLLNYKCRYSIKYNIWIIDKHKYDWPI